MKIVLEIKDAEKAKTIVNFLSQNPYIKIKDIKNIRKREKTFDINLMFGLWKKEAITKEKIREKAWGY